MPSGSQSPAVGEDKLLELRREDLAALTAAYLRESRSRSQWVGVAAGIAGLALGPILMTLGLQLGWSPGLDPYFFVGGWAIMLAFGTVVWRRERTLRLRYQFKCPSCDALLLNGIRDQGGLARVELIVTTGACPHCAQQILAP